MPAQRQRGFHQRARLRRRESERAPWASPKLSRQLADAARFEMPRAARSTPPPRGNGLWHEAGGERAAPLRRTGPPRAAAARSRLGAPLASLRRREASASQAGPSSLSHPCPGANNEVHALHLPLKSVDPAFGDGLG